MKSRRSENNGRSAGKASKLQRWSRRSEERNRGAGKLKQS